MRVPGESLGADTRRRRGERLSGLIALGFLALAITLLLALL